MEGEADLASLLHYILASRALSQGLDVTKYRDFRLLTLKQFDSRW